MSTFVSVGNAKQPFDRLVAEVVKASQYLPQPVFVQYATSKVDLGSCDGAAFLNMEEFQQRVANATLLIMHAGAGSVIHAIGAGKVPVVVPRRSRFHEHVDDHQVEFANEIGSTGKIIFCPDPDNLTECAAIAIARRGQGVTAQEPTAMMELVRSALEKYLSKTQ